MKKLLIILALTTLISCNKDNQVIFKDVTYKCYTEQSKATLHYINKDGNWQEQTINQQNYVLTIQQTESNFNYQTQLKSQGADSLHITGTVNGLRVEDGRRSSGGSNNISIQISNAN